MTQSMIKLYCWQAQFALVYGCQLSRNHSSFFGLLLLFSFIIIINFFLHENPWENTLGNKFFKSFTNAHFP